MQLITALAAYVDDIENVASSGVPLGISYLDLARNLVYKRGTPGRGPKTWFGGFLDQTCWMMHSTLPMPSTTLLLSTTCLFSTTSNPLLWLALVAF